MKVSEWKTYRTRFLVKAKQLNSTLTFTDHLGRKHCGRKGDYLVESYDGVLSIAPQRIFEDVYVSMPIAAEETDQCNSSIIQEQVFEPGEVRPLDLPTVRVEPLTIEPIKPNFAYGDSARRRTDINRTRRKSPMSISPPSARAPLM